MSVMDELPCDITMADYDLTPKKQARGGRGFGRGRGSDETQQAIKVTSKGRGRGKRQG